MLFERLEYLFKLVTYARENAGPLLHSSTDDKISRSGEYRARVIAFSAAGSSPPSFNITFTTANEAGTSNTF